MTRCFTIALLAFALLGAFGYRPLITAARADDFGFDTPVTQPVTTKPTPPTPAPTTGKADDTTTSANTTTAKAAETSNSTTPAEKPKVNVDVPKHAIPSRVTIQDLVADGDYDGAESAYLEWENAWQQFDSDLIITVESHLLQQSYANGDFNSLVALLHAGDPTAMKTVRTMLRTGKTELTPDQFATAVLALASRQELSDYTLLTNLTKSKNLAQGDIAIMALGNYGDKKAIPFLISLLGDANIDRSILIVKTVMKLGGKALLIRRYTMEMKSPLSGMPERAAMLLSITGDPAGWNKVQKILDDKTDGYYPQALGTLGNLPIADTESYVANALAGSEAEQLNAIASIDALSSDDVVPMLQKIIGDKTKSDALRLAALSQLAMHGSNEAQKALRNLAFTPNKDITSVVTVSAIYWIVDTGQVNDSNVCAALHQQLFNDDKPIATAARGALLVYAENNPQ
jgi:hypothetical protein